MGKETPKTKSAFVKWAYIKASNCSTVPKTVLFEERIPENILELQCATEVAEIILDNGSQFRYWITYRIRIYSRKYIPAALLLGTQ